MTDRHVLRDPDTPDTVFAAGSERDRVLQTMTTILARAGVPNPHLDARFLVADVVLRPGALSTVEAEQLRQIARRRLGGEPVDRILGNSEFWSLRLDLNAQTLIPRPDTETIVETALRLLSRMSCPSPLVLDLGTGSGAILIALLHEHAGAIGVGVDLSPEAVAMARHNADQNGVGDRATFLQGDWMTGLAGRFDLIVSNPPYIPTGDIAGLAVEVREHDPLRALDGGDDGLDAYRAIAAGLGRIMPESGRIVLEIGAGQGPDVIDIMDRSGFSCVEQQQDLAGHVRALVFAHNERRVSHS